MESTGRDGFDSASSHERNVGRKPERLSYNETHVEQIEEEEKVLHSAVWCW